MKITSLLKLIIAASLTFGMFSCAKDRAPQLLVSVTEGGSNPAPNAIIRVWHGGKPISGYAHDDYEMDQTIQADGGGSALFCFRYSAVLDIDVIYYKSYMVGGTPFTDTL